MKIAVTYDNGTVFQHFGKSEQFKVYETEGTKILSSEVISSNGEGHSALADLLARQGVTMLVCGGIGAGAREALKNAGIGVCAGAEGDCDLAVKACLEGTLVGSDACCDHSGEGHSCGHKEEGACGSSQEGECGGCEGSEGCGMCPGHRQVIGKNVGHKCTVHYRGTLNDGTQFDSSYDRGQPLEFVCGAGNMIFGFDQAVANMNKGEIIDVHLMPEDAYGMINPYMIMSAKFDELPGSEDLQEGEQVIVADEVGSRYRMTVIRKDEDSVTLDGNHPFAGKELNFRIELVDLD